MTHYDTLGVQRDATEAQIKRAYRKLSSRFHPDRDGGDPERMQRVNDAYAVLGDPERRARYDASGDDKPQVDPVQAEAQQVVLMAFRKIIDEGGARDIIQAALDQVAEAKRKLDGVRQGAQMTLRKLEKLRGKVRVADGNENLFEGVLTAQINAQNETLRQADHGDRVHAAVLAMLSGYGCDVDPPPAEPRFDFGSQLRINLSADRYRRRPWEAL